MWGATGYSPAHPSYRANFNPRPPCGGRRVLGDVSTIPGDDFNPRPPCGGRPGLRENPAFPLHFNPRPPCGGRPEVTRAEGEGKYFNPRPPCGGRLAPPPFPWSLLGFQSTPPVWGATVRRGRGELSGNISIHAPRVGGDRRSYGLRWKGWYFNPRPPCGGRLCWTRTHAVRSLFQSTPPVWGATIYSDKLVDVDVISIHAPRVGGDDLMRAYYGVRYVFQSTPPVWGATLIRPDDGLHVRYFNPRPPCGGRLAFEIGQPVPVHFNPRPPCGGRRGGHQEQNDTLDISIHAPRVGGDDGQRHLLQHGEVISIHAPRVGGDLRPKLMIKKRNRFQSTPPVWGATPLLHIRGLWDAISIHAPRVGGDD